MHCPLETSFIINQRVNHLLNSPNFFHLFCFLIFISYKTLLVKLNRQANPLEISMTINPKPVIDIVTKLEVVAILTKVSTVLDELDNTLYFSYYMFDLRFSSSR